MQVAFATVEVASEGDLALDFIEFPILTKVGAGETGPHVAFGSVLRLPPSQQGWEALLFAIDGPVKLRSEVVNPSFLEPQPGIGEQAIVGIKAADSGRVIGPPYAERADADFDPRFGFVHGTVERFDEEVHISASPVGFGQGSAGSLVGFIGSVVWELGVLERRIGVGVEVIIKVNAIDIVSLDDIGDDLEGMSLDLGEAWIHPLEIPIGTDP